MTPELAFVSGMVGLVFAFIAIKSTFRSAFGMAVSFSVMLGLSQFVEFFQGEQQLALALSLLAVLVMAHNILIHWRHAGIVASNDPGLDDLDLDDEEQDGTS